MDQYIIAFYWEDSLNFLFALHSAAHLKLSLIHWCSEHAEYSVQFLPLITDVMVHKVLFAIHLL